MCCCWVQKVFLTKGPTLSGSLQVFCWLFPNHCLRQNYYQLQGKQAYRGDTQKIWAHILKLDLKNSKCVTLVGLKDLVFQSWWVMTFLWTKLYMSDHCDIKCRIEHDNRSKCIRFWCDAHWVVETIQKKFIRPFQFHFEISSSSWSSVFMPSFTSTIISPQ